MEPAIDWVEFNPPERSRVYRYPSGSSYTFLNVKRIEFRKSGIHRVETIKGEKAFVAVGWETIVIDTDNWSK